MWQPPPNIFLLFFFFFPSNQNNPFYVKPRVAVHNFGVKHYAGEVISLFAEIIPSRTFISLIFPQGCSKLTKALCSLSTFYSTAVVRGAWLFGLLFEPALFPSRSSMMSGGYWRRTEILLEMISWTCYVKAGKFLQFLLRTWYWGVLYQLILPGLNT